MRYPLSCCGENCEIDIFREAHAKERITMRVIQAITNFINAIDYETIPPQVRDVTQTSLTDSVAVMLAGVWQPQSNAIKTYLSSYGNFGQVPVVGLKDPLDSEQGALAYGFFAHALDFDNSSNYIGHSAAILTATITALAPYVKKTGEDALRAYATAMEVIFKLAEAMVPEMSFRGWHITPVFGTIGATITAAILLDLTEKELEQALALATSHASGMMVHFGTPMKFYHCGMAASNGIRCCRLAQSGLVGSSQAFEGKNGFFKRFAAKT